MDHISGFKTATQENDNKKLKELSVSCVGEYVGNRYATDNSINWYFKSIYQFHIWKVSARVILPSTHKDIYFILG